MKPQPNNARRYTAHEDEALCCLEHVEPPATYAFAFDRSARSIRARLKRIGFPPRKWPRVSVIEAARP
jgi:hypothetical protein